MIDEILAECIDAVLSGERTIDECLETYPEYADELKPELQIALLTSRLKSPVMSEKKVAALEKRLHQNKKVVQFPIALRRLAAVVFLVMILLFGGGGGVVYASSDSLPGDTLYGIKRWWEGVVVLIADVTNQLDDVWLQLAQTRLAELQATGDLSLMDDFLEALAQAQRYATPDTSEAVGQLELTLNAMTQPTITPTTVILPSATPTQTATATATATITHTATVSPTRTPRIPPTPTRTPTPTQIPPTATQTLLPTMTASNTPTLLPTPTERILPQVTQANPTSRPVIVRTSTDVPTWYPWPRLTQDALYATRTAEAGGGE